MEEKVIRHPKVVLIGAGSLYFGRQAIWAMTTSPYLNKGTLALVDTNEKTLEKMKKLAYMVKEANDVELKIEASTERKDVLAGADFVVLSFAERSVYYRGIDCQVSAKYGIRMCSGDTIGPGGIFRAMREFPVILECASDIEVLCPDAWVINYINPTAVHGIGLRRNAPGLKSFALCDGLHMPHVKKNYAIRAGVNVDLFDLRIAGVNHFTWILKAGYEGRDVAPVIAKSLKEEAARETDGGDTGAKAKYNSTISYELYDIFGYIPACVGHTKEYVRFWQGKNISAEKIPPLSLWETEERYIRHADMWKQVDDLIEGKVPAAEFMKMTRADHATDIIESMVADLGKRFYINTFNNGAVTNMNDDSFLELQCDVSMDGIKTLPVGEMPRGIRGMEEQVLDTHELTAEAIAKGSYSLLRRAMMTDPLVCSISDADAIIKELLDAEKEQIPVRWHK